MNNNRVLLVAAGGTGGHMFPAQALSDVVEGLGWSVILCTDKRGARYTENFSHSVKRVTLVSASLARGNIFKKICFPFLMVYGLAVALSLFIREKPNVVVGFGGYPTFPAILAAKLLNVPCILHEQNAVLGRVNSFFSRWVDFVACGMILKNPPEKVLLEYTGNPVRKEILKRKEMSHDYVFPESGKLNLLIIGGSQGAGIFSSVVPNAIAILPVKIIRRLVIYHQARPEDHISLKKQYEKIKVGATIKSFFENIGELMFKSHLVIARAGASTIAELTIAGRPSVLVPLPSALMNHQTLNSESLSSVGGTITMPQQNITAKKLKIEIESLLTNKDKALAMARCSLKYSKPLAAKYLAEHVEKTYERSKN